jgi:triacylglycerol lipase
MFSQLSPQRRRLLMATVGFAVVAGLIGLVAILNTQRTPARAAADPTGPVLVVPGYGANLTVLEALVVRLRAENREVRVVTQIEDGRGDLREQAEALNQAAQAALDETGASSVDVVGYSAGGVVARWWVKFGDGAAYARRILTLGSPHHGTQVAQLAVALTPDSCSAGCAQLAIDSDLLRRLNAGDETPAGPDWVSVWTAHDRTVVPADSAVLEGAVNVRVQDICQDLDLSHGELPESAAVLEIVVQALAAPTPGTPSPEVC